MSDEDSKFVPDETLKLLETIASKYDATSAEYAAIELAAKGLLFIHASGQGQAFATYLATFEDELTEEQREALAAMGLREEG